MRGMVNAPNDSNLHLERKPKNPGFLNFRVAHNGARQLEVNLLIDQVGI